MRETADILVLRELELPLADIAALINGAESRLSLLRNHARALRDQRKRIRTLIASIDSQIEVLEKGGAVSDEALFNSFTDNPYEDEASEQWGNTEAYRESARRVKSYGPEDWKRFQREMASINDRLVAAMHAGEPPTDARVMEIADEHRMLIDQWFYPCSHEFHRGLGDMYIADQRFTKNIDKAGEGLAAYMREGIDANADRANGVQ